MNKIWSSIVLVLLLSGVACGPAPTPAPSPTPPVNVVQILQDMRWAVMAACASTYLPAVACTFAYDTLGLADALAVKDPVTSGPAVRKLLVDAEGQLPPASPLRPYLDGIIAALRP